MYFFSPPSLMSRLAALRLALQSPAALATLAEFLPTQASALAAPAAAALLPPPASSSSSPLLDLHARRHTYLRLSLTERCNLRCTYCMPAQGAALTPTPQLLTHGETLALATHFVALGVTKIRLTGGEPTTHGALLPTVRALAQLRARGLRTLAMTSNGVALAPPLLQALWGAGLDALNLSLDTLQPRRFAAIARRPPEAWGAAWRAVHGALAAGWGASAARPLKVNCVVQRGVNEDEAGALARALTQHHPVTLRFIEFMPFAGNEWGGGGGGGGCGGGGGSAVVPSAELLASLQRELPGVQAVAPAEGSSGTLYRGGRDWRGSFAFISTVTGAFCSSCTRLRLTADGALRACLHGEGEVSLRDVLRSGGGDVEGRLSEAIGRAVRGKHAALGGRALAGKGAGEGRSMVKIGG